MMKKLVIAIVAVLGLLVAAGAFLLATEPGARWTLGQVLAFTGAPVEIERIEGRLIGPLSLAGVSYRDPVTGTAAEVDSVELDWRPTALLEGLLHVSRLRVAGVEYTGGEPVATPEPGGPPKLDIALPLAVQIDQLEVESVVVASGEGGPFRVAHASLKGAVNAGAATLEDINIDAGPYGVENGRVRLGLEETLPLEASLAWRAQPEGLPAFTGTLETGGALTGTVEPRLEISQPFQASARGSVANLFEAPGWTLTVELSRSVSLDTIRDDWPALSVAGRVEAEGDTAQARLLPDLSLGYQKHDVSLTADAQVSADGVTVDRARIRRPNGDTLDVSGGMNFESRRWTVTAEVPAAISLDGIQADWPPLSVAGRVEAEGNIDQARIQPDLSLAYQEHDVTLAGDAVVTVEGLTVETARVRRPNGDTLDVSGRMDFETRRWAVTAEVPESVALDGIRADWPPLSVAGRVEAEGNIEQAHIEPDLALAYQGRDFTLSGDALVSADGLTVDRARLARPDGGAIDASGRMDFETRRWTVSADIPEALSLDRIVAGWPPLSVAGRVEAEGDAAQARVQPDLAMVYQARDLTLTGDALVSADGLKVDRIRLRRPAGDTINISGRVDWGGALPFSVEGDWQALQGPDAAPWSSPEGEFRAEGDLRRVTASLSGVVSPPGQGPESPVTIELEARDLDASPKVAGTVRLPYFRLGEITARELSADLDFDADSLDSAVTVKAAAIEYGERVVNDLAIQARGNPEDHVLTLAGRYQAWTVDARAAGAYSEGQWRGSVRTLNAGPPEAPWRSRAPADLAWSPEVTRLERLCLKQGGAEVCAAGRFEPAVGWGADVEASGIPVRWLAVNAPPELRVTGLLGARARLDSTEAGIRGEANAAIERATVEWQGDNPVTTRYENIELTAELTPELLSARLDGRVENDGVIDGELTTRDPLAEDGALEAHVTARLPSLRLLQAFVPALGLEEGRAIVEANISGSRLAPRFDGEARIEEAVVSVAMLGTRFTALNARVRGEPGGPVRLEAQARSGEGTLETLGRFEPREDGSWQGEITLTGNDAELVSLPRALIVGNPDLRVEFDPAGGRVTGRVDFTRASLTPDAGRPGITISDDIVVVDGEAEEATANPMAWRATVTIDLGPDTRFRGYGLKAQLTGALDVDAPPGQPTRANGAIELRDGKYDLYGRTFDIERGRIVYAGGPVDNPGIDLRVGREVGDVKVSLSLSGPLVDPRLTLSSSPPMSDTDKMSYLLLGRPASQASGADATLLLRAASSLLPGGGAARDLPGLVRSTLDLDTLEVRSGDSENEGASLVLGKYLAPRLYVSYVAGFQQAVDVFRVRYELTRHWLLRAESSIRGSGGDILLTW